MYRAACIQLCGHGHHYLQNNPFYVEKVTVRAMYNSATKERAPTVTIRGDPRRAIVTCLQRRSKILAATNLNLGARDGAVG
jgi:hypothetical protein